MQNTASSEFISSRQQHIVAWPFRNSSFDATLPRWHDVRG